MKRLEKGFLEKFLGVKKKQDPEPMLLYKQFKAASNTEVEKPEDHKKSRPKREAPVKRTPEKKRGQTEKKRGRPERIGKIGPCSFPVEMAICSIKKGCGCSHMAEAVKHYLDTGGNRVCLISADWQRFGDYGSYNYIIKDFGCFYNRTVEERRDLNRAGIKLMLCLYEKDSMAQLADFVRGEGPVGIKRWHFLFNFVPDRKKKEVAELMEDYSYYFLPLFDREGNEADKIVKQILGGGA